MRFPLTRRRLVGFGVVVLAAIPTIVAAQRHAPGEILGADGARRIYEEIVRRSGDPAPVEWLGQGLVRTRIFPILPGVQKRVVLRYTQPARREGDALRVDWRASGEAMGTS
ncbi:MAG: hypothetical protein ACKO7Z_07345 [Cyanobacteriota bacterium]